jgi:hypothetical protein
MCRDLRRTPCAALRRHLTVPILPTKKAPQKCGGFLTAFAIAAVFKQMNDTLWNQFTPDYLLPYE